mgnify:CR=1 FL=1
MMVNIRAQVSKKRVRNESNRKQKSSLLFASSILIFNESVKQKKTLSA